MKKLSAILVVLLALGFASLAQAQATRTWVSGVGDDANPCSRTAPCKTFAGAISKTASPGIINCLDPGGFGAVTITKSIMIDCTGTIGSVLSSGVQGVIVNALATDKVILRNIDITGAGTTLGTNGINIAQAGSVSVEGVTIETYSARGIETTNSSNAISVFVSHSTIENVGAQGVLALSSGTGTTKLTVAESDIHNNTADGVDVACGTGCSGSVFNTNLSKNGGVGFQLEISGGTGVLEGNNIVNNTTGVNAGAGTTIRMTRNTVSGSTANGIGTGGGTTKCFGTNMIDGNVGGTSCSLANQGQQ